MDFLFRASCKLAWLHGKWTLWRWCSYYIWGYSSQLCEFTFECRRLANKRRRETNWSFSSWPAWCAWIPWLFRTAVLLAGLSVSARWAPMIVIKWRDMGPYNGRKYSPVTPCNWAENTLLGGVIGGVITLLVTGMGPPCRFFLFCFLKREVENWNMQNTMSFLGDKPRYIHFAILVDDIFTNKATLCCFWLVFGLQHSCLQTMSEQGSSASSSSCGIQRNGSGGKVLSSKVNIWNARPQWYWENGTRNIASTTALMNSISKVQWMLQPLRLMSEYGHCYFKNPSPSSPIVLCFACWSYCVVFLALLQLRIRNPSILCIISLSLLLSVPPRKLDPNLKTHGTGFFTRDGTRSWRHLWATGWHQYLPLDPWYIFTHVP